VKTWFWVPLDNDWGCVLAHECIDLHNLVPLFKICRELSQGKWMNTRDELPGKIKPNSNVGFVILATHKSPFDI
jgi:hypothetical protein